MVREKQHLPGHVIGCIVSECLGVRVVPASKLCVFSVPGCGPRGDYSGQEAFVGESLGSGVRPASWFASCLHHHQSV